MPAFIKVSDAVKESGLSRNTIYELLHREENPLPHIKVGKQFRIDAEEYLDYLRAEFGPTK